MAKKPVTLRIHECNKLGQHRIVTMTSEQGLTATLTGDWAEAHELATLGSYYACNDTNSVLPVGIFRVNRVPAKSLGD